MNATTKKINIKPKTQVQKANLGHPATGG